MKERPILFSTEMVQSILDGRKTETRRVIKPPFTVHANGYLTRPDKWGQFNPYPCPYGKEEDLLYVRETWAPIIQGGPLATMQEVEAILYKASVDGADDYTWKPSIHMKKIHSRIWLRVKEVKVERLQDITTEGIKAEGVQIPVTENDRVIIPLTDDHFPHKMIDPDNTDKDRLFKAFWIRLWDSINAGRGYPYKNDPWLWVVKFEVVSTDGRPG